MSIGKSLHGIGWRVLDKMAENNAQKKVNVKVSVVVPVRNNQEMIAECIESLLNQDFHKDEFEIIIVDNNSTDNTAEIIKRYPVKYLFEGKTGRTKARNTAIKHASGDIICFTDSDCVAHKSWIRELAQGFNDASIGGVGGKSLGHEVSNLTEKYIELLYEEYNLSFRSSDPPQIMTGNAAYRARVLEEVGCFDESFETSEDYDLSARVFWSGYRLEYAPKAIVYHRHRSNLKKFFAQYFEYGRGYVRFSNKHRSRLNKNMNKTKLRHFYYRILSDPKISPDIRTKIHFYFAINVQNLAFLMGKTFERTMGRFR